MLPSLLMYFVACRMAGVNVDFLPVPVFCFFTGRKGVFLAKEKINLRVDSKMFSWFLMLLRGTLIIHNSIATLMSTRRSGRRG